MIRQFLNFIHKITAPTPAKSFFYTKDIFEGKPYHIGEYTYGHPEVLFHNRDANLTIGKFCSIASNVKIFLGGNHRTDWITTYPFNVLNEEFPEASNIQGHPSTKGGVVIGNDVWIASNVIILSGISIGNGAVIGAGSVVSKDIKDYEIWAGNPAKFIKNRFDQDTINKLTILRWWDWEIDQIKKELNYLCNSPKNNNNEY